jgi:hypothetical protein
MIFPLWSSNLRQILADIFVTILRTEARTFGRTYRRSLNIGWLSNWWPARTTNLNRSLLFSYLSPR